MQTINVHQVDAFTDQLFGGNPAGVVSNADGLSDVTMTRIARELNLSETAFVLRPQAAGADLSLRFFTPDSSEIDFCGHATVGALFQLAQLNLFGLGAKGKNDVAVHTKAGTLEMSVDTTASTPRISFTAPGVAMEAYPDQGADFAKRLGIPTETLAADQMIYIDRVLRYIYIPTTSLDALKALRFDFNLIRKNFADEQIVVLCLYTAESVGGADLHARGLAPLVGIDEDPFTGSMQAGLLHASKLNKLVAQDKAIVKTEQGHFVGRPGFALLQHDTATNTITITAEAVPVFSAQMEII